MNLDGRNLMKLAAGTGMRPVWSPAGSKIAFGLMEGGFHIYSINPDGSELQNLTADSGGILPSWSPDGSQIAFKTFAGELWVMNADGSNKRRLADQLMLNMHQLEPPSWSPDGTSICFTRGGVPFEEPSEEAVLTTPIYVVRVDGSNLTRLTTNPALDHDPVWSPRGGHEQLAPPAPPIPLLLTPSPMPPKHFFRPNEIPLEDGRGSIRIGEKILPSLKDQDSATMVLASIGTEMVIR